MFSMTYGEPSLAVFRFVTLVSLEISIAASSRAAPGAPTGLLRRLYRFASSIAYVYRIAHANVRPS